MIVLVVSKTAMMTESLRSRRLYCIVVAMVFPVRSAQCENLVQQGSVIVASIWTMLPQLLSINWEVPVPFAFLTSSVQVSSLMKCAVMMTSPHVGLSVTLVSWIVMVALVAIEIALNSLK